MGVAVLAVHNVVGNLWLPQWTYVPVNLMVGAILVVVAFGAGVTRDDITGPRARMGRGLVVGSALGAGVAAILAVAAAIPGARDAFSDDRVVGVGAAGLLYHVVVRIPLGTALFEEAAFRGVVPALARGTTTPMLANLLAAVLFGLWHVIPASSVASGNAAASSLSTGVVVAGAVVATGAAGLGLSWLKDHHGLAAPLVLHAVMNSAAFTAAWLAA
jgi:membrane protease YdiL (CAAX protease family)